MRIEYFTKTQKLPYLDNKQEEKRLKKFFRYLCDNNKNLIFVWSESQKDNRNKIGIKKKFFFK